MSKELILVVGASGTVGSTLVKQLKDLGYRTRSTTSKPVKQSNEVVQMNLGTGDGLKAAFEGVDRAFLLSPPGYADQYSVLSPLIQESKRRGLKRVVLMTAMGANANPEAPFRKAEIDLEQSGLSYNIIRPNWFFQNFNTFWVQEIQNMGQIQVPGGNASVSFIDARDISSVATKLLTSDEFKNKDFDLTGPDSISHQDVANAISKISGRAIEYKEISPEVFKDRLTQAGFPKDYIDFMNLIFGFLRQGYSERKTTSVRDIIGQAPRSLNQYVNDFKEFWKK